jgi:uncharacterized protein
MQFQNLNYNTLDNIVDTSAVSKTFVSNVFSWMAIALGITSIFAYFFGTSAAFISSLIDETGMKPLGWVVMLAPLAFVLVMSFAFNKLSALALTVLFITYSFVMGMSLSFIFLIYTSSSIYLTFGITAATFGTMAILGYTTKTDLSKFGAILGMALVGLLIAMLVNFFMKSQTMDYVISVFGVLIFTGLTAWDIQKIKRIGATVEAGSEPGRKYAIMGALTLYLDFVNLFLFLLRFMGNRK